MITNRFQQMQPFNGLSKDDYLNLTKPAVVNYVIRPDGKTAVLDIEGFIGRDIITEWLTGEKSENTVKNIKSVLREINTEKIIVNINSPGGDLNDGLVIMNMLQSKNAEIVTNVMGFSASAATVIAQAGSKRRMPATSFQLLHRVMFGVCGYINQNTFRDLTADCEVVDDVLIGMYERRSNMTAKAIGELMDEGGGYGKWISAEDALKHGLIDEIYDPADEEDEDTDHLEGEDKENRMRNIQKLNATGVNSHLLAKEEHETNSGSGAAARARKIETLKRKMG